MARNRDSSCSFFKTSGIGFTGEVPPLQAHIQSCDVALNDFESPRGLARNHYLTDLIRQITGIQEVEYLAVKEEVPLDVRVLDQGAANVVDLPRVEGLPRRRQKGGAFIRCAAGREVDAQAFGAAPYAVELRLDEYARPLPYGPACHQLAAVSVCVLLNDGEALAFRRSRRWTVERLNGFGTRFDLAAKGDHVRGANVSRRHGGFLSELSRMTGIDSAASTTLSLEEGNALIALHAKRCTPAVEHHEAA